MLIRDPGAATAIRHGGNGRALVMVSSDNFREDEFRKLAEVFAKDNVQLVAASPNYGTGKKDHGSDLKASFANLNFSQVKPADFDAIFVLGGSCILESDEEKKVVKEIILTASKNNVEIAGSNEGYQAIMATSIPQQHEFKRRTYHKTHNAKDLANTANKIFSDLRSKKK